MHPNRIAAQKKYEAASQVWHDASNGNDEVAFIEANARLDDAGKELADAEVDYPTADELSKRNRRRELSNRGLDA